MSAEKLQHIVCLVYDEAKRAADKFPPFNSHHEGKAVIEEEFDEYWDLVKLNPKKMNPSEVATWRENLSLELIQTAAMCVRALHDLCE